MQLPHTAQTRRQLPTAWHGTENQHSKHVPGLEGSRKPAAPRAFTNSEPLIAAKVELISLL